MPRLEDLTFEFQFYGGPPNTDPPMGIKHLVRLEEVSFQCNKWYRGDSPCISAIIDVVKKEALKHPNRIEFELRVGAEVRDFPRPRDHREACSSSGAQRKRPRRSKLNPSSAQHT